MAEFYRRNPELLWMHPRVGVECFEVDISLLRDGLDVREPHQASAIGFPYDRLTSSDLRADVRYRECRVLAGDVDASAGGFIAYPSAAYTESQNLVTMVTAGDDSWVPESVIRIALPDIDADRLNPLPVGADK